MKVFGFFAIGLLLSIPSLSQNYCSELARYLADGNIEKATAELKLITDSNDPGCNNLIGEVHLKRGDNQQAEQYFDKALAVSKANTEVQATSLNNLALVYWNTGNNNQAREYLLRALHTRENLYGNRHEKTAASLNDLGLILSNSSPNSALDYYEQSLAMYQELTGSYDEKIAQIKINIGVIYRQLEFYGDAVNNFNDALTIWQKLYPQGHPNEGFVYTNLGNTSLAMGNPDEALQYFNKALAIYVRYYGERHPEIANIYSTIGNIYHGREEFDIALDYYQKAIIANAIKFNNTNPEINPTSGEFYNNFTLLSTLYAKSQAFMDKSIYKTLKFNELKLSLETLYICDSLIDITRRLRTNESDKIALGISAAKVYETGVLLCNHMAYESIKKDPYYEQSFYFTEKSKSAVLLEAIADAAAKSFAGIPNEELIKENNLRTSIAYYEQELAKKPEEEQLKRLQEALFNAKSSYDEFIKGLEQKYPKYYDLKYNVSIPTVSQIQMTLDEGTVFYSYFIAKNANKIIIYEISKNDFNVIIRTLPNDFFHFVNGYLNGINYQAYDLYTLAGQELYKILFPEGIPKNTKKLIIIPAGRLGTIPYGALLAEKVKSKTEDYTSLPYLNMQYAISYQYAATLYYQQATGKAAKTSGKTAFLCAPVTFKRLPDLPGTSEEIANLKNVFDKKAIATDILLEDQALESIIKTKNLHDYQYIHFATHGLVNEASPELSRLSLYEIEGESEDGDLFSGEIYNLDLSASLVTLSACETGLGKISEGEGIIGLSRAFAYAGASNILVSLWSVSDRSTANLMIDFYDAIEGENYAYALKVAQSKLIAHPIYSKPFYWAPFIIVGQ